MVSRVIMMNTCWCIDLCSAKFVMIYVFLIVC